MGMSSRWNSETGLFENYSQCFEVKRKSADTAKKSNLETHFTELTIHKKIHKIIHKSEKTPPNTKFVIPKRLG